MLWMHLAFSFFLRLIFWLEVRPAFPHCGSLETGTRIGCKLRRRPSIPIGVVSQTNSAHHMYIIISVRDEVLREKLFKTFLDFSSVFPLFVFPSNIINADGTEELIACTIEIR